jgi:hypothetical protein
VPAVTGQIANHECGARVRRPACGRIANPEVEPIGLVEHHLRSDRVRNTGPAFFRTTPDPLGPGSAPVTSFPFVAIGKRSGDTFSRNSPSARVSQARREPYSAIEPNWAGPFHRNTLRALRVLH